MNKGTPKTLVEAISNGLDEQPGSLECNYLEFQISLRNHVKDFLAQKFMVAMIKADLGKFDPKVGLKELFEEITK